MKGGVRITLKIVTVNVEESSITDIEKLVGDEGLYPSRSELIRVAVREFLMEELRRADNMAKFKEEEVKVSKLDPDKFVRVPVKGVNEANEPVREFKTYRIIRRLEH